MSLDNEGLDGLLRGAGAVLKGDDGLLDEVVIGVLGSHLSNIVETATGKNNALLWSMQTQQHFRRDFLTYCVINICCRM